MRLRQRFKTVEFIAPHKTTVYERSPGDRSALADWYADRLAADGVVKIVDSTPDEPASGIRLKAI